MTPQTEQMASSIWCLVGVIAKSNCRDPFFVRLGVLCWLARSEFLLYHLGCRVGCRLGFAVGAFATER